MFTRSSQLSKTSSIVLRLSTKSHKQQQLCFSTKVKNLINGEFVDSNTTKWIDPDLQKHVKGIAFNRKQ